MYILSIRSLCGAATGAAAAFGVAAAFGAAATFGVAANFGDNATLAGADGFGFAVRSVAFALSGVPGKFFKIV